MASKILLHVNGTPKVWANSGDYAGDGGACTHQINLTSLASGAARQGAKADMAIDGSNHLPQRWSVTLRVEFDVAPADNKMVTLYWAPSLSGTPATANPGGCSGSDAAYTGTPGSTLAESLLQLQFIGALHCTNDAATEVQQQTFITTLPTQYGMPVVVNDADQAFEGDAVEMSVTFTPLEDEAQ